MKRLLTVATMLLASLIFIACDTVQYTVTFDSNGGSSVAAVRVSANALLQEPDEPELAGYDFDRWYKDESFSEYWNFAEDRVNEDMTLYANWLSMPLTVTFETDGGTEIEELTVTSDSLITVPTRPEKPGHQFVGWYKDGDFTNPWNFNRDRVLDSTMLYARYREITVDYTESFKVLSIGNSFSEDAQRYLVDIALSYGIPEENIVVANMFIGGAELTRHINNIQSDAGAYTYQRFVGNSLTHTGGTSLSTAIAAEDWDVVTFQQASHHSGLISEYEDHVETLSQWAKDNTTNDDVVIAWHQTWAYEQTSNHSGFSNYNRSQTTMYNMINDVYVEKVQRLSDVEILIPSGTAIQNARTSWMGDRFTRDGYHLTDPLGRYIGSLSYFKAITGFEISVDTISFAPLGVSLEQQLMAFEAANNAYNNPYQVTNSIFVEEPDVEPIVVEGIEVEFEHTLGYWNIGSSTVVTTEGNSTSFVAVMPIHRSLLPVGSEIVIESDHQYRVIFLSPAGENWNVLHRTGNFSVEYQKIDEDFWGDYEYIAFNLSTTPTTNISSKIDEVAEAFKIYHPEGTTEDRMLDELEFDYVQGYWNGGATDVSQEGTSLHDNFAATMPIHRSLLPVRSEIVIEEGYRYRIVFLRAEGEGYRVLHRTDNIAEDTVIDAEFWGSHEFIAFNISPVSGGSVVDRLDEVAATLTLYHPPGTTVGHINRSLTFELGVYEASGSGRLPSTEFVASNALNKDYFEEDQIIGVASGYEYALVELIFDEGRYAVVSVSSFTSTELTLTDTFWAGKELIAFMVRSTTETDLSDDEYALLALTLSIPEVPHVDEELSFILGYWNMNSTSVTTTASNSVSFGASNIFSQEWISQFESVTVESGWQIRVVFLIYDNYGRYQVVYRIDNLSGTISFEDLADEWPDDAGYVAFNISTAPTSNLSDRVSELVDYVTFNDKD